MRDAYVSMSLQLLRRAPTRISHFYEYKTMRGRRESGPGSVVVTKKSSEVRKTDKSASDFQQRSHHGSHHVA